VAGEDGVEASVEDTVDAGLFSDTFPPTCLDLEPCDFRLFGATTFTVDAFE
jgi:hypothetical protein